MTNISSIEADTIQKEKKQPITPNQKQQECIDGIEGAYMVLAGPGTGKTFTLTQRIVNMVNNKNINPNEILCLTYTEAAVKEMRKRFLEELGIKANDIMVTTYHGFCNEIIATNPEKFGFTDDLRLIDQISKEMIARKCIDNAIENKINLDLISTQFGDYYYNLSNIIKIAEELKTYNLSKEDIEKNMKTNSLWEPFLTVCNEEVQQRINNNKPVPKYLTDDIEKVRNNINKAEIYLELAENYSLLMKKYRFFDFADMVSSVVNVTKEDSVLAEECFNGYKYIMVDEYQDTNKIQKELIDIVADTIGNNNICVVGDDDQTIFGFQGANYDNCKNFLRKYPFAKVICLNENNRSTQNILDFSYETIKQDGLRIENNTEFSKYKITKKLEAKNKKLFDKNKPVEYLYFEDQYAEQIYIIDKIKEIIACNPEMNKKEIAIIVRKNSQFEKFIQLLQNEHIPYQKKEEKSIFAIKSGLLLYSYLKILNNGYKNSDKQMCLLQQEPFLIDERDYNFILSKNVPFKRNVMEIIEENIDYKWENSKKINKFTETYKKLQTLKQVMPLKHFILTVINETGILEYFANSETDVEENILALKRILEEAEAFKEIFERNPFSEEQDINPLLNDFMEYLDKCYLSKSAQQKISKTEEILDAVQLTTYHSSKGREFEYVFMPSLNKNLFEEYRGNQDFDIPIESAFSDKGTYLSKKEIEDEKKEQKISENLKILFVGITRAKHSLTLSFAANCGGKRKAKPTELLQNVLQKENVICRQMDSPSEINSIIKNLTREYKNNHKEFLQEAISKIEINAHNFNCYRACPRKFLYQYVYKIPTESGERYLSDYGTAMHKAYECIINKIITCGKQAVTKEEMTEIFVKELSKYNFDTENNFEIYRQRGIKCIDTNFHYITEESENIHYQTEYSFKDILISNSAPMKINGKIDYIQKLPDGTYALYDYKTGNKKSTKEIAINGKNEDYYYQLAFYKIAFEKEYANKKVSKAGFKFVEKNEEVPIVYDEEEIEEIKEKIIEVMNSIINLEFSPNGNGSKSNNTYDKNPCNYCPFTTVCSINSK